MGIARFVLLIELLTITAMPASGAAQKFIGIDDDPQLGNSDAKVTIIEFGDYQCPSCRAFWRETLPRIKKEYVDTASRIGAGETSYASGWPS
jgi:protein-disulfide isomerase